MGEKLRFETKKLKSEKKMFRSEKKIDLAHAARVGLHRLTRVGDATQ